MKKYKSVFMCLLFLVLALALFFVIPILFTDHSPEKAEDFSRMGTEEYQAIFVSMYPIDNFAEEDFGAYAGVPTIKAQHTAKDLPQVSGYLKKAFASGNGITHIYLGLEPEQIWADCKEEEAGLKKHLQKNLLDFAKEHPEVSFDILLPFSSLKDWLEKDLQERNKIQESYFHLLAELEGYANVRAYFIGAAHWLVANPGNYQEGSTDIVNEVIAQKIMMYVFCDGEYVITSTNAHTLFGMLDELIAEEEKSPHVYPDLSEWCIVFFGDSIIGNYTGSFSVPGVVEGLSGADAYNCAIGGSPAVFEPEENGNSPGIPDFLAQDADAVLEGNENYRKELLAYLERNHEGQKLCFVLNYGLNDYFNGYALDNEENPYDGASYGGALRADVKALKEAYPDAHIILSAPNYTSYFEHGQEIQSENGGKLTDYVETAGKVAEEMGLPFLNNYADLGINIDNFDDYLADGCHLNEEGRFLMAERLIELIAALN